MNYTTHYNPELPDDLLEVSEDDDVLCEDDDELDDVPDDELLSELAELTDDVSDDELCELLEL